MSKFVSGQRVTCNGNTQARVIGYYSETMINVRLWSGYRHVGDVCVSEHGLTLENEATS